MKTKLSPRFRPGRRAERGLLMVDLVVGMAILTLAILPVAFSFVRERQLLRAAYCRAVAIEIVDGEMEILAAGAARDIPDGTQTYTVHAQAVASLPPGHFQLTRTGNHLRLEWTPEAHKGIGVVVREITLQ
jgi:hypothetical protein